MAQPWTRLSKLYFAVASSNITKEEHGWYWYMRWVSASFFCLRKWIYSYIFRNESVSTIYINLWFDPQLFTTMLLATSLWYINLFAKYIWKYYCRHFFLFILNPSKKKVKLPYCNMCSFICVASQPIFFYFQFRTFFFQSSIKPKNEASLTFVTTVGHLFNSFETNDVKQLWG